MKRQFWRGIKENALVKTLIGLEGNPRTLVFIEPLWGIPFHLIAPFISLYMFELGVSDIQIGLLASVTMLVQVFFAAFGGIITDKLGRKKTTMMGDFLGWVLPCIIWAVAQNFWFFLAAMLLNSFEQVNQTAWNCLMIEDADRKDSLNIYTWVTIAGLCAVFFAPISGALIPVFSSVIPVMRVLYFVFAAAMFAKNIITWRYAKETKMGVIRMEETKNTSFFYMLSEYRTLIPKIFKNPQMLSTLLVTVIMWISNVINSNFFALYVSENLLIPKQFLAYFPIFRAALMLIFMFAIQHKLASLKLRIPMGVGYALYIAGHVILILSPMKSVLFIFIVTFLEAIAFALVIPRKDSMMVLYIDEVERARIVSFMTAISIAIASPFGYIAGLLSSVDRRLPFLFTIILYTIALGVVLRFKEIKPKEAVVT